MKIKQHISFHKVYVAIISLLLMVVSISSVLAGTVTVDSVSLTSDVSDLVINYNESWIKVENATIDNESIDGGVIGHWNTAYGWGFGTSDAFGFTWAMADVWNATESNPFNQDLNTTDSPTFADLNVTDDIYIADRIYHKGDLDTYIRFMNDRYQWFAGGLPVVQFSDTHFTVNYDGAIDNNDINFKVQGAGAVGTWLFHVDAGLNRVGIRTGTPDQVLDVNGNTNITGDVNVTGNIISNNVFLPAYLRAGSRSTIAITVGSQWENITFNQSACGLCEGFAHTYDDATNDTFTVNNSGIYRVTYFIACEDSAVTPDAHVGFRLINATAQTIIKGSYGEFDTHKKDKHVFKEHSFITQFDDGDQFKIQFTSDDTTVTLTPHITFNPSGPSCQISINKIANI